MKGGLLLLLVGAMCLATGRANNFRLSLKDVKRAIDMSWQDYKKAIDNRPNIKDEFIKTDAGARPNLIKSYTCSIA